MCKFKTINFFLVLMLLILSSTNLIAQPNLLDPATQNKFVNPLPVIKELGLRVDLTQGGNIDVQMVQTTQDLGLQGVPNYATNKTNVWAYQFPDLPATYPGATIVAHKQNNIEIEWQNNLPAHFLPVDASLHMAHPDNLTTISDVRTWYASNTPVVTHLHGGHTESASDGLPEAWFTQGFAQTGNYFVKPRYHYDNTQESATLWYHDHALGITRLNVYAGLAGFYLLRDNKEDKLIRDNVIPGGDYEIEIVIQDRMFDENGQLFWPAYPDDPAYSDFITGEGAVLPDTDFPFPLPTGGGPTALAEFFGDFILVNGMAWPYLNVEPRKYRFRLLNGSDSRFYVLEFRNTSTEDFDGGTPHGFLQIGTDDGLLEKAVSLDQLLIAPGERMDLVVDFSDFDGESLYLRNFGPDEPYGGGEPDEPEPYGFASADEATTGQIMKFNVNQDFEESVPNASVEENTMLGKKFKMMSQSGPTRSLVLFEGSDEYGRLMPMLGTLDEGSMIWDDEITENPMKNDIEVWEVYNATGDAHPIHLHLVAFQIINRESFNGTVADKTDYSHSGAEISGGLLTVNSLGGDARDPEPNEKGWKDTAVMLPGEVTRVIAKFDLEGRYVWHCHILSHEDHEMMRPFYVSSGMQKGTTEVLASVTEFSLGQNFPNPFNPTTTINFSIPKENTLTSLKIYNSLGQEVGTLLNQVIPAGNHEVQFDASELSSGVYFYVLKAGNFVESRKMMLLK